MLKKNEKLGTDEDAGVVLSTTLVVAIVLVSLAGVLAGLWKIDVIGLVLICAGAFVLSFFFPLPPALVLGSVLIAVGLLLWFDILGAMSPFRPSVESIWGLMP